MSVLLQFQDIRKTYGTRVLLDGATGSFSRGQKIGGIGRNGAGKSTLLKILLGEESKDSGTISKSSELRLSYLEQHDPYKVSQTPIEFLSEYTGKEEWECAEMAAKFKLSYEQQNEPIEKLAGGYRTRVKLAAMLLTAPNFLILDEPTNYLDLSTLLILEKFLQNFKGGFLIVSHDREFLKRTCNYTLEVENGKVTLYPGSIEGYFEYKEEQLSQKLAYNKTIEKKKDQLQNFVDRFGAKASKATSAKSKMKQIQKLQTIDIDHVGSTVKIRIPNIEPKAGIALDTDELSIGYADATICHNISMQIDRGERVAILGDNGQGKTTFMRTVAGDLEIKGGLYKWGAGLNLSYYAQHVFQNLHADDDVLTHLSREAAEGVNFQDVLDMAGCFLFQGDDVKKKISVLSGGERARLVLAGLLLAKHQVLLLDEPTNHLDFDTVEALAVALKKFSGTVFFISHDRTFVNMVATSILEVDNGKIVRYPGLYEEYVDSLRMRNTGDEDSQKSKKKVSKGLKNKVHKDGEVDSDEEYDEGQYGSQEEGLSLIQRKKILADLKKNDEKSRKLEVRIANLTAERDKILKDMAENPFYYKKERSEKLNQVVISLEAEEAEWYNISSKQEKLRKRIEKNED